MCHDLIKKNSDVSVLHRDGEGVSVSVPQVRAPPNHTVRVRLAVLVLLC